MPLLPSFCAHPLLQPHTTPFKRPYSSLKSRRPALSPRTQHVTCRLPDAEPPTSSDDDALNRELQAKVRQLFGSRSNVSIDVERESGYQFSVRRDEGVDETKMAWTVIKSIAVISVVASVLVVGLYYSGNIHGSDPFASDYPMPTYGEDSYIDPYELLEDDRVAQESELH